MAVVGLKPLIVGGTFKMLTLKLADPPPGAGVVTIPLSVPGFAVSLALRENVIVFPDTLPWALPSDAVVRDVKPLPVTVTDTAPDPALIELGLTLPTAGTGFDCALTVNVIAFEVPPPGGGFVMNTG